MSRRTNIKRAYRRQIEAKQGRQDRTASTEGIAADFHDAFHQTAATVVVKRRGRVKLDDGLLKPIGLLATERCVIVSGVGKNRCKALARHFELNGWGWNSSTKSWRKFPVRESVESVFHQTESMLRKLAGWNSAS